MARRADDFGKRVRERLAGRAGHHCSNPTCRRSTSGPSAESDDAVTGIGVAAHISAASPGGRRYDASISTADRRSIRNGIWLCQTCSVLIDRDAMTYTVDVLRGWKAAREADAQESVAGRLAARDQVHIAKLAGVFNISSDVLEESLPVAEAVVDVLEVDVSGVYSRDREAIILIAELGNVSRSSVTIKQAALDVPGVGMLSPRDVLAPDSFYVEGHEWLGTAPYRLAPDTLINAAWFFSTAGWSVRGKLIKDGTLACHLSVQLWRHAPIRRHVEVHSLEILRLVDGLRQELAKFPPRVELVLRLRFGIGGETASRSEIASRFSISVDDVDQIVGEALDSIRSGGR